MIFMLNGNAGKKEQNHGLVFHSYTCHHYHNSKRNVRKRTKTTTKHARRFINRNPKHSCFSYEDFNET